MSSRPPPRSRPAALAGHRIWMPGIVTGTEWAAYYSALGAAFGLTIDATGPNFGTDLLLEGLADSPGLATLYPHSLIWRSDNPHPALTTLRSYLSSMPPGRRAAQTWTPPWAQRSAPPGRPAAAPS